MSYSAPFAASSGEPPAWHKSDQWTFGKKYGRTMSDCVLNGANFNDHFAKYNSSAYETPSRHRQRLALLRKGIHGGNDYDAGLAETWKTVTSAGFEPHDSLVHPDLRHEMTQKGLTFTKSSPHAQGLTFKESVQLPRRNPGIPKTISFGSMFKDRDKGHGDWDGKLPAGPHPPPTPKLVPKTPSAPPSRWSHRGEAQTPSAKTASRAADILRIPSPVRKTPSAKTASRAADTLRIPSPVRSVAYSAPSGSLRRGGTGSCREQAVASRPDSPNLIGSYFQHKPRKY